MAKEENQADSAEKMTSTPGTEPGLINPAAASEETKSPPRDLTGEAFDLIWRGNPREHLEAAKSKLFEVTQDVLS